VAAACDHKREHQLAMFCPSFFFGRKRLRQTLPAESADDEDEGCAAAESVLPEVTLEVDTEKLLQEHGVHSAALPRGTAGIAIKLRGFDADDAHRDPHTFCKQLAAGLGSLGGPVSKAMEAARLTHLLKVVVRGEGRSPEAPAEPQPQPPAPAPSSAAPAESPAAVAPTAAAGWVHVVVAVDKATASAWRGHGLPLDPAGFAALNLVHALVERPLEAPLEPLGAHVVDAAMLADSTPVAVLRWGDVEGPDDPARRDSVGQRLTDVRKVWWAPNTSPPNPAPGTAPSTAAPDGSEDPDGEGQGDRDGASRSPGGGEAYGPDAHGATRVVTKWINRGLSLCSPRGSVRHTGRYIEKEAAILDAFHHRNILPVVGIFAADRLRPAALAMPNMETGSLRHFLRAHRARTASKQLRASLMHDVASGLEFLHAHKMWHGDVAARNVLIDHHLLCKITNVGRRFGVSRWSAPEIFRGEPATASADVWSFGILVFEVVSKGRLPYPDADNTDAVGRIVRGGGIPDIPRNCPPDITRRLLQRCWVQNPAERPTAVALRNNVEICGGVPWGKHFTVPSSEYAKRIKYMPRFLAEQAPPPSPSPSPAPSLSLEGQVAAKLQRPQMRGSPESPLRANLPPNDPAGAGAEVDRTQAPQLGLSPSAGVATATTVLPPVRRPDNSPPPRSPDSPGKVVRLEPIAIASADGEVVAAAAASGKSLGEQASSSTHRGDLPDILPPDLIRLFDLELSYRSDTRRVRKISSEGREASAMAMPSTYRSQRRSAVQMRLTPS